MNLTPALEFGCAAVAPQCGTPHNREDDQWVAREPELMAEPRIDLGDLVRSRRKELSLTIDAGANLIGANSRTPLN